MKTKLLIPIIIFILALTSVSAVTTYWLGNQDGKGLYGIQNATSIRAQSFIGDGSGLTNVTLVESDPIFVANNASIWNAINLRLLTSTFTSENTSIWNAIGLRYLKSDTYNKTEIDTKINDVNGTANNAHSDAASANTTATSALSLASTANNTATSALNLANTANTTSNTNTANINAINSTVNTKLNITDQRYNDTAIINSVNNSAVHVGDTVNASLITSPYWLNITDQRYNETTLANTKLVDVTSANSYIGVSGTTNKSLTFSESLLNSTIATALQTTYYNVTNITVITGSPNGTLQNIQVYDDIPYNISEVNSDIDVNITINNNITNFNQLVIRYRTVAGEVDTMAVSLFDNVTQSFQGYITLSNTDGIYNIVTVSVLDPQEHILANNTIKLRLSTTNTGARTDKWNFDLITASKGVASAVGSEIDPLSIHRNGDVPLTANWATGGFNITGTQLLDANDQRYNETTLINTKLTATATTCSAGNYSYFNGTGFQCSPDLSGGAVPYQNSAAGWTNTSTNTSTSLDVYATNINANMSWSYLKDYPTACSAGNAITGLGDSTTCTAFLQTESDPKVNVGNITSLGFNTTTQLDSRYGELATSNLWTGFNNFNPTTNTTFNGLSLFYGTAYFFNNVVFTNTTTINVSSGIKLYNIANQTIGTWGDNLGNANLWTNGWINSTGLIYENGTSLNSKYNETPLITALNNSKLNITGGTINGNLSLQNLTANKITVSKITTVNKSESALNFVNLVSAIGNEPVTSYTKKGITGNVNYYDNFNINRIVAIDSFVDIDSTGTVSDVYGVSSTVSTGYSFGRSGIIKNYYGFYNLIDDATANNITNAYGLKIEDVVGTNVSYAIYTGLGTSRFGGLVNATAGVTVGNNITMGSNCITFSTGGSICP